MAKKVKSLFFVEMVFVPAAKSIIGYFAFLFAKPWLDCLYDLITGKKTKK